MFPVTPKSLLPNANGDLLVTEKSDTLGLKSRTSDNLVPSGNCGISLYLSCA